MQTGKMYVTYIHTYSNSLSLSYSDALFFSASSFPALLSNFSSLHLLFDGSFSDANEESSTSEVIVSYFKKEAFSMYLTIDMIEYL